MAKAQGSPLLFDKAAPVSTATTLSARLDAQYPKENLEAF